MMRVYDLDFFNLYQDINKQRVFYGITYIDCLRINDDYVLTCYCRRGALDMSYIYSNKKSTIR
jgi:hypothetical protein